MIVQNGPNATIPLTLQSLFIKQSLGTSQSPLQLPISTTPSVAPPSVVTSALNQTLQSPGQKHQLVGIISGAIVGGLVFIVIIVIGGFFLCRRRTRGTSAQNTIAAVGVVPEPFPVATGNVNTSASPKCHDGRPNIAMPELEPPPVTKWTRASVVQNNPHRYHTSPLTSSQEEDERGISANPGPENMTTFAMPIITVGKARPREEDSGFRSAQEEDPDPSVSLDPPVYTMQ